MQNRITNNLVPSERISLFSSQNRKGSNPEEMATTSLLQISDEDYSFDPIDHYKQPVKPQKQKISFVERNIKSVNQLKTAEGKQLASDPMSKTCLNFRKTASKCIAGQEVCVMRKDRVINLSNFLVLENNQLSTGQSGNRVELEDEKNTFRIKPPKNIVAFIRKRNIAHLKEQFNNHYEEIQSPTHAKRSPRRLPSPMERDGRRVNMSCQLKRSKEDQVSPSKYQCFYNDSDRIENISPDFRSTSPSFRNKRVSNYLRYRSNKADPK